MSRTDYFYIYIISDIISFLDKKQQLINEAIEGNTTSLIDLGKLDYLKFVTDFEWSYSRFKDVCKYLDLEVIENKLENTFTFNGKGSFMIVESYKRSVLKKLNPAYQYQFINTRYKFQSEIN
jgi:hypothetical protein